MEDIILDLTLEQTKALERNIKLKNEAEKIYRDFLDNVTLKPSNYKGEGMFLFWKDSHNATYFTAVNDVFHFNCRFLHESYDVTVTPSGIFNALKNDYRGVEHLISAVKGK